MIDVKQIAENEFEISWDEIDVKENPDGTFNISWDPNDPIESMLSTWTEEDFIREIKEYCEQKLQSRAIIPEQS